MKRRWPRRLLIATVSVLLAALAASLYVYFNLRDIVVWFANRGHPRLALELRRAELHRHRVEFSDIVLKLRGTSEEAIRIDSAVIDFSWRELRERCIEAITVKQPRIRVSDRLIGGSTSGGSRDTKTPQSTADAWRVKRFTVLDGSAEIDLVSAPLIRFSFTPDFHDLYLSTGARHATEQQSVALENIELVSRDAKPEQLGTIKRIVLKFSQLEAGPLNFDELEIETPSLHIAPAALATRGNAGATSAIVSNSNGVAANVPNLRIGKLRVENGEAFIHGFGETVPEGSFKFGIDTDDLELGDTGAALEKRHEIQLWDLRLAPAFAPLAQFVAVDSIEVAITPNGLLRRGEIASTTVTGMTVTMGKAFRSFMNAGNKKPSAQPAPTPSQSEPAGKPWKLRELDIVNSRITLADLGVGASNVSFNIETTLKDIPLSAAVADTAEEIQQQELADLAITSPFDPFAPVFTMKTLFVRYSIAGLLRREIEEIHVLNPTIYIGEDLFWYLDELGKREAESQPPAPAQSTAPSTSDTAWKLKKFSVAYGQLVIASGGQARVPLPLTFATSAENLNLGNLSDARLSLDLKVPREDYFFPGYKLELRQLAGDIQFGLPPQSGQNNLVQTLRMSEVRWRQYRADDCWLAVTFDSQGINGELGARGYGGYLKGGFSFFFGDTYPWIGWMAGTAVDLEKITGVMAPGNLTMNGPADFKLEVNGASSSLERLRGSLRTKQRGEMRIVKLDQMLADLPADWWWLKRESTRILLETLRDFTYDTGDVSFWFANDEGNLKLTLRGPGGSRNVDLVLHGDESSRR